MHLFTWPPRVKAGHTPADPVVRQHVGAGNVPHTRGAHRPAATILVNPSALHRADA